MQLIRGLLGWSNKRGGLEIYNYHSSLIPRHNSPWGDLLVDHIDRNYEGCPIIVVIMDRKATEEEVNEMRDGIASQVVEVN